MGLHGAVQVKSGTASFLVLSSWAGARTSIRHWVSGRKGCVTLTGRTGGAVVPSADPVTRPSPWDEL